MIDGASSRLPGFTVVVPTHARPRRLGRCLGALSKLDYPRDKLQIVIVDDGSPASLRDVVGAGKTDLDVALVEQDKAGPAAARNTGAQHARLAYLAFTDDDCAPDVNWLLEFANAFVKTPHALIGGRTVNALQSNLYAAVSQELVDYLYQYFNTDGATRFLTSNNIALPTDRFRALGGFSASFPLAAAEDRDLCRRWLEGGNPMGYAPEALVRHSHELTMRSFARQHFGYGRGAHGYHRRRAARGGTRLRIEPLRFYTGLLAYPRRQHPPMTALAASALMFMSQVANAAGFFFEKARTGSHKKNVAPEH